ncbi:hypothetical protein DRJ17_04310 [Candidatus Woesearchaeota archaeon]|nr:MAG: hypothetical protein DRJ17_04310 [Candidatus Woesearchaeota archaeon]
MEAKISNKGEYSFDIAKKEDFAFIKKLVLLEYAEHPNASEEYLRWRYWDNPVFEAKIYIARDNNGSIVGIQPVSKVRIANCDSLPRFYLLTGAVVHPDHRRKKVFKKLIDYIIYDLNCSPGYLLYTFPNELSMKAFNRFEGWQKQEEFSIFIRPTSLISMLIHIIRRRSYSKQIIYNHTLRKPENYPCIIKAGVNFIKNDSFHAAVDLHRNGMINNYIHIERSQQYLNWRYSNNPSYNYAIFTAQQSGSIVGYLIVHKRNLFGFKFSMVIDIIANEKWIALELLKLAIRDAQGSGMELIAFMVGMANPFKSVLLKQWFIKIPRAFSRAFLHRAFCLYVNSDLNSIDKDRFLRRLNSQWYINLGDTDVA